jgi:hypothetical protein
VFRSRLQRLADRGKPRARRPISDLDRDLSALAAAGKKLTFVFSRFDPGHDTLMMNSGALIRQLRRKGSVKIWCINGTNHTFDTRRPRNELIASIERHLVASYPAPPARRPSAAAPSAARQGTAVS